MEATQIQSEEVASRKVNFHFEIRFGREAKMYTLWRIGDATRHFSEQYIQNLSTDLEAAVIKANEMAGGLEVCIDAPDDLKKILRGDDVIRFGKWKDTRIKDVPTKYLLWIFKGCPVPSKQYPGETDYMQFGGSELRSNVQEFLVETGVLQVWNDKLYTAEIIERIKARIAQEAGSEFVGKIGDRITFEAVHYDYKSFDTAWGNTSMYFFRDDNDNIFIYKGSSYLQKVQKFTCKNTGSVLLAGDKAWKNLKHIGVDKGRYHTKYDNLTKEESELIRNFDFKGQDANYINLKTGEFFAFIPPDSSGYIQKGERVSITATIKDHTEYNGTKQNFISRLVIK